MDKKVKEHADLKKEIPFCILKILQEQTDKYHPLNNAQIMKILEDEYELTASRGTVYNTLNLLRSLGYDISSFSENNKGSYLDERMMSFQEATLLINAIKCMPFLEKKRVDYLVEQIASTQSIYARNSLANLSYIQPDVHTNNNQVFVALSQLDKAVRDKKKVKITYLKYGIDKKLKDRGKEYILSPYGMVFTNEHYYLACLYEGKENLSLYRIDRIKSVEILEEKIDKFFTKSDIKRLTEYAPCAMPGEQVQISMIVNTPVLDAVIDRFGRNITIIPIDETKAKVILHATEKGMKYWALQFLDEIEILEPASLRDGIIKSIQNCAYLKKN